MQLEFMRPSSKCHRYEERKRQKREQEKADRAAQRERRRAEVGSARGSFPLVNVGCVMYHTSLGLARSQTLSKLETMTEEEKLKWRENKAARVQGQRQIVQDKRARLQQVWAATIEA